jgi:hypothetical protein
MPTTSFPEALITEIISNQALIDIHVGKDIITQNELIAKIEDSKRTFHCYFFKRCAAVEGNLIAWSNWC